MKTMYVPEGSCETGLLASHGRMDLYKDNSGTFATEGPSLKTNNASFS